MRQKRPFQVVIDRKAKAGMLANKQAFGRDYGVFFDTSGKARIERVNPTRQYEYLWTTKQKT